MTGGAAPKNKHEEPKITRRIYGGFTLISEGVILEQHFRGFKNRCSILLYFSHLLALIWHNIQEKPLETKVSNGFLRHRRDSNPRPSA